MSNLMIFDWETTDKYPSKARGVQFAAILVEEDGIEHVVVNQLCNPGEPIDPGASNVHGIYDDMVVDAQPDHEVAVEFREALAGITDLITAGHNTITFDIPITDRLSAQSPSPTVGSYPHIDTMVLAQRVYPLAPNHKLSALVKWLGLGEGENAHDALEDVRMVYLLIKHFEANGSTLSELATWVRMPYVHEYCHFGKHKGKKWKDLPYHFVKWMTETWDDPSPDMRATVKHYFNRDFKL